MSTLRVIAGREFSERLRSRLFLGVNAFLVLVIVAGIAVPALVGDRTEGYRLGVADDASAAVAEAAASQSAAHGIDVEVVRVDGREAGEAAVSEGDVEAVLVDGSTLVTGAAVDPRVEIALASAAQGVRIDAALDEAGVSAERRAELLAGGELVVEPLDGDADDAGLPFGPGMVVLLFAIAVLYGLLIFHGQWVAQGIVEEKQSRVIEVLLSAVRPTELLAGKIAGLGLLGLAQVALLAGVALATMGAVGAVDIPEEVRGAVVLLAAWYVLGFLLYATLFATSGAVAARSEELQATTTPIIVLLVVALLVAQAAMASPRTAVATVAAYVPFTAPMVQPVRYAAGASSWAEGTAAAILAVVFIAALVPVASRLYRGGVLKTRARVSLRDAWRSSDTG